jgi:hypothetical protein
MRGRLCGLRMFERRGRPTLDALRAQYAARGQKVSEVVKVVDGNRYRYARVWNPSERTRSDIYLGPVEPKRLGSLLTEKDLLNLEKMFGEFHEAKHRYAETVDRVLEAWRIERESGILGAHKSGAIARVRSGRNRRNRQL